MNLQFHLVRLPGCSHWQGQRDPHNPKSLNASSKSNRLGSQARNLFRQGHVTSSSAAFVTSSLLMSTVDSRRVVLIFRRCVLQYPGPCGHGAWFAGRKETWAKVFHTHQILAQRGVANTGGAVQLFISTCECKLNRIEGIHSTIKHTILYPWICPMRPLKLTTTLLVVYLAARLKNGNDR